MAFPKNDFKVLIFLVFMVHYFLTSTFVWASTFIISAKCSHQYAYLVQYVYLKL